MVSMKTKKQVKICSVGNVKFYIEGRTVNMVMLKEVDTFRWYLGKIQVSKQGKS